MKAARRHPVLCTVFLVAVFGCGKRDGENQPARPHETTIEEDIPHEKACVLAEVVLGDRNRPLEQRLETLEKRAAEEGLSRALGELVDAAEGDRVAKDVPPCAAIERIVEMRRAGEDDVVAEEGDALADLQRICEWIERRGRVGSADAPPPPSLRTEAGRNVLTALAAASPSARGRLWTQAAAELGAPSATCPALAAESTAE